VSRRRGPRQPRVPGEVGGFQAGPGIFAALDYRLLDAEGEGVESSSRDAPLCVVLGFGQLPPAVERALEGAGVGDERVVRLAEAEGFGPRDPELLLEVSRDELPEGVAVGDELAADSEDGDAVILRVVEVDADRAVLDANHPLAGQPVTLRLVPRVLRPATQDELDEALAALQDDPAPQPLLPADRLLRRGPRLPSSDGGGVPPGSPPVA